MKDEVWKTNDGGQDGSEDRGRRIDDQGRRMEDGGRTTETTMDGG